MFCNTQMEEGEELVAAGSLSDGLRPAVSLSDISQQQLQAQKEELMQNLDMDPYDEDQVCLNAATLHLNIFC